MACSLLSLLRRRRCHVLSSVARAVGCAGVTAGCTSAAVLSSPAPPAVDAGARTSVTYGPATLAGTNIVVFGGSSGIGKAIALGAAQQGAATVHIIGRDEEKLAHAKAEITTAASLGTTILTSSVDVTDEAAVKEFFANVAEESVDHLVTTPGGSAKCGGASDFSSFLLFDLCAQRIVAARAMLAAGNAERCVNRCRPDQERPNLRRCASTNGS